MIHSYIFPSSNSVNSGNDKFSLSSPELVPTRGFWRVHVRLRLWVFIQVYIYIYTDVDVQMMCIYIYIHTSICTVNWLFGTALPSRMFMFPQLGDIQNIPEPASIFPISYRLWMIASGLSFRKTSHIYPHCTI